jgi:hypothetical protein
MRRVIPFLAFFAVAHCVSTPSRIAAQTRLGVRAGLNLATFGGTDFGGYNHRAAGKIGAFLDIPFSERVGLQLGVGYSGKGAETAYSGDGGETVWGKVKTRIGYLEVPALLRLRVVPVSLLSAHLFLGPTLSFKVSCEVKVTDPYWGGTFGCDDSNLDVRAMDLGATGGFGVEVGLYEAFTLVGESSYTHGLRTVGESGDGVKNRSFSLSLGVAFPIG